MSEAKTTDQGASDTEGLRGSIPGTNIYYRWSKREKRLVYSYQKSFLVEETGKRRKFTEKVPEPYRRRTGKGAATSKLLTGEAAARQFKIDIDKLDALGEWVPTQLKRKRAVTDTQKETQSASTGVIWDAMIEEYLASPEGSCYADQRGVESRVRRLNLHWEDWDLSRPDTQANLFKFYDLRLQARGVYSNHRPVLFQSARDEMSVFGAAYNWYRERHPEARLPFLKMQPTTSTKKNSRYKKTPPVKWFIPEKDVLVGPNGLLNAIFTAKRTGATNREQITDEHRVLWMLCLFGAARPESEPCRLYHGHVTFIEHGWALISYRNPKNDQSKRTIPIPPPVAAALKVIMVEEPPPSTEAHDIWSETPIFRKGGRSLNPGAEWDNKSYKEAWTATKAVLAEDFPMVLQGAKIMTSDGEQKQPKAMVLRDLRRIARVLLRKAGIAREVYRRYLGHVAETVDDGYDEPTMDDLREASEALTKLVYGDSMSEGLTLRVAN